MAVPTSMVTPLYAASPETTMTYAKLAAASEKLKSGAFISTDEYAAAVAMAAVTAAEAQKMMAKQAIRDERERRRVASLQAIAGSVQGKGLQTMRGKRPADFKFTPFDVSNGGLAFIQRGGNNIEDLAQCLIGLGIVDDSSTHARYDKAKRRAETWSMTDHEELLETLDMARLVRLSVGSSSVAKVQAAADDGVDLDEAVDALLDVHP